MADAKDVREWAKDKGIEVGSRGRLSQKIINDFNTACKRRKDFVAYEDDAPHGPQKKAK